MRILAIETSGRHGSVALLEGCAEPARLVHESILSREQRTAQTLAPAMQSLLTAAEWTPTSIELVAVAAGPGSFTGLRIGVTTAKAFAYACGAAVIGVHTLAVLAAQAPTAAAPLWAILDAQRQELFAARFPRSDAQPLPVDCETMILGQDAWLAELKSGEHVIGPALRRLAGRLPAGVIATHAELWQPRAATVGQVGWRAYLAGRRDDVWRLTPEYGRSSYAEEKRK